MLGIDLFWRCAEKADCFQGSTTALSNLSNVPISVKTSLFVFSILFGDWVVEYWGPKFLLPKGVRSIFWHCWLLLNPRGGKCHCDIVSGHDGVGLSDELGILFRVLIILRYVFGLIYSIYFKSLASTKLIPCSTVILQTSFLYWNLWHILDIDSCAS